MNIDRYKNKYVSILGDSISTFEGISQPKDAVFYNTERKIASNIVTSQLTWWGLVIEKLKAKLLVNNSISGSTVTWQPSYQIQSYGCSDERTSALGKDGVSPDVIIVYLGTNDWGAGVRLLSQDTAEESQNLSVFSTAYCKMLEKLKNNYPSAEIWCITLAVSCFSQSKTFEFPYFSNGWHISKFCEVIQTCASKYGCKIIDLFNDGLFYDTVDGFHPNDDGMKTIANAVLKSL